MFSLINKKKISLNYPQYPSYRELCLIKHCFMSESALFKVVIITNLGQKKNQHKMLKIKQIFPKLYRCLLYVVFHNLKPQNAGLVDVKKDLNSKISKGIFVRENLKNKHSY